MRVKETRRRKNGSRHHHVIKHDEPLPGYVILNSGSLARLRDHKYSASGQSFCEFYLQTFWKWLVELMPLWLAPNLITLIGLIGNIVTTLLLMFMNQTASEGVPVPSWAYMSVAIGVFVYQSLDAIDGKQARRTESATPLGELFDHGCDSLSCTFLVVALCSSLQLGPTAWTFYACLTGATVFYTAHWRTYVTGVMNFGKVDVTEGQLTMISVHLVSAILGPEFWSYTISGIPLKHFFAFAAIGTAVITCLINIRVCLAGGPGREGTTIAETSVISPVIPLALCLAGAGYVYSHDVFVRLPLVSMIAVGLAASKISIKVVLAHMSKSSLELWDWSIMLPFLVFKVNSMLGLNIDETYIVYFLFLLNIWSLGLYCVTLVEEICMGLNIRCFTIPYPPPKKKE